MTCSGTEEVLAVVPAVVPVAAPVEALGSGRRGGPGSRSRAGVPVAAVPVVLVDAINALNGFFGVWPPKVFSGATGAGEALALPFGLAMTTLIGGAATLELLDPENRKK